MVISKCIQVYTCMCKCISFITCMCRYVHKYETHIMYIYLYMYVYVYSYTHVGAHMCINVHYKPCS